ANRSASAKRPPQKASSQAPSTVGSAIARVKPTGSAPIAARSERLTASALCPTAAGSVPAKKWRPSTSMSLETASACPSDEGASSAQSSPMPSRTPAPVACVRRWKKRRISPNSPRTSASRTTCLVLPYRPGELVRHPVLVLVAVGAAEALGELHRLVDHDAIRNLLVAQQLVAADHQRGMLHRAHQRELAIQAGQQEL